MNFWVTLISFFVCVVIANVLIKLKAFAYLRHRSGRFDSLDGLRGYLAISVFFHHFVVTYYWKITGQWASPPESYNQNYGKVGVAVFFMITGFLFISKLLNSEGKINWLQLFESRFFRIFPLYILAVLSITLIVFHDSDYRLVSSLPDLIQQYLKWFVFHGSNINEFTETGRLIAYVDWTLKYEWLFYLSLPILSLILFKGNKFIKVLLLVSCFLLFLKPIWILSFSTQYFILFVVGGLTAYILTLNKISPKLIKSKYASLLTLSLLIGSIFHPFTFSLSHIVFISAFFMLVAFGNDLFGIFQLKSSILLGEISFSIYLLHGMLIYLLFTQFHIINFKEINATTFILLMPIVSILVVLIASITFLFIEKPCINYGRQYSLSSTVNSIWIFACKALQSAN